jgi:CRP-like cAMP-binding protein
MDYSLLLKELQFVHEGFSKKDFERFIPFLEERSYKKSEHLFKAGDVVKQTFFIQKGILRQYYINHYINPEGAERNIYFVEEGTFAGELMSFLFKKPTHFYCQALEDAEILSLNRENWEIAFTTIPSMALYQLKKHAQFIFDLKKEMGEAGKETPDEKYRRLVKQSPNLLQRLPQYHVAAYLGITPETLSRIRRRNTVI